MSSVLDMQLILFKLLCWAMLGYALKLLGSVHFFLTLNTRQSSSCLMAWRGMDPYSCSYLQWVQSLQAGAVSLCCNTDNALLELLSCAACCIP